LFDDDVDDNETYKVAQKRMFLMSELLLSKELMKVIFSL